MWKKKQQSAAVEWCADNQACIEQFVLERRPKKEERPDKDALYLINVTLITHDNEEASIKLYSSSKTFARIKTKEN
jgi:hypothetical protein